MADWQYYLYATLFAAVAGFGWLGNFVGLPGNWLIVAGAALFAWLGPSAGGAGITWAGVALLTGIVIAGEAVELLASMAGAAKQKATKRAMFLSVVGAMFGGMLGIGAGVPIPIIGSLVGAVVGSALGAFAGAYLGQHMSQKSASESFAAGRGAFVGRLWGVAGKLASGLVAWIVLLFDLFLD